MREEREVKQDTITMMDNNMIMLKFLTATTAGPREMYPRDEIIATTTEMIEGEVAVIVAAGVEAEIGIGAEIIAAATNTIEGEVAVMVTARVEAEMDMGGVNEMLSTLFYVKMLLYRMFNGFIHDIKQYL